MLELALCFVFALAPQHADPADTMTASGEAHVSAPSHLAELKAHAFDYKDKTVEVGLVTLTLGDRSGHVYEATLTDGATTLEPTTYDLSPIVGERLAAAVRERFGDEVRARVSGTVKQWSSGWLLRVTRIEVVDAAGNALATISEAPR